MIQIEDGNGKTLPRILLFCPWRWRISVPSQKERIECKLRVLISLCPHCFNYSATTK